jgi:putative membrane protein
MRQMLAAPLIVALSASAWAQTEQPGSWHMHDWGMGWGMGWGGGMVLGPLLTIGLVILLVVLILPFVRSLGSGAAGPRERTARDILDERYAKGEIDREEYLRRRQDVAGE